MYQKVKKRPPIISSWSRSCRTTRRSKNKDEEFILKIGKMEIFGTNNDNRKQKKDKKCKEGDHGREQSR